MNENTCKTCRYYRQHFTLNEKKLIRVYCGHCVFARVKNKRPDAKACENYLPGTLPENAFASKEYLSKELLQYMLRLELLPKIEENG